MVSEAVVVNRVLRSQWLGSAGKVAGIGTSRLKCLLLHFAVPVDCPWIGLRLWSQRVVARLSSGEHQLGRRLGRKRDMRRWVDMHRWIDTRTDSGRIGLTNRSILSWGYLKIDSVRLIVGARDRSVAVLPLVGIESDVEVDVVYVVVARCSDCWHVENSWVVKIEWVAVAIAVRRARRTKRTNARVVLGVHHAGGTRCCSVHSIIASLTSVMSSEKIMGQAQVSVPKIVRVNELPPVHLTAVGDWVKGEGVVVQIEVVVSGHAGSPRSVSRRLQCVIRMEVVFVDCKDSSVVVSAARSVD